MSVDGGELAGALILSGIAALLAWGLTRGLDRLLGVGVGASPRRRTRFLTRMVYVLPAIRAFVWFVATLVVISILLGVESTATAFIGIFPLALGLGLALRDYFADVVAGIRLALERPFQSGDRITFGGVDGTIMALGLTHTRIVTEEGRDLRLPNRRLAVEGFETSKSVQRDVPVEVLLPVPDGMAITDAKAAAYRAAAVSRFGSPNRRPEVYLESTDEAVKLRVRAYVSSPVLRDAYRSDLLEIWLERSRSQEGR